MPRRHFKDRQLQPLQERLAEEAKRLREKPNPFNLEQLAKR
jgi:hypothetical protein